MSLSGFRRHLTAVRGRQLSWGPEWAVCSEHSLENRARRKEKGSLDSIFISQPYKIDSRFT